jgi:pyridoxamine 5'-phosphate oxidase
MSEKQVQPRKDYRASALTEDNLHHNPFSQFEAWFDEAVFKKIMEPDAMVLSTATADGRPSGRVVLLRGMDERGFLFFTNYESKKGKQLGRNPYASLTFHWKELERQIRIEGKVEKVSKLESNTYFDSRPLESRISAIVSPQSSAIPDRTFLEVLHESVLLDSQNSPLVRPPEWGGFRLKPFLFEFWQGREHRLHDRLQFTLNRKIWTITRLAP